MAEGPAAQPSETFDDSMICWDLRASLGRGDVVSIVRIDLEQLRQGYLGVRLISQLPVAAARE
jgi:hypothetical protein